MNKIRIGVIGAGWWATFAHIPALLSHPQLGKLIAARVIAQPHEDLATWLPK